MSDQDFSEALSLVKAGGFQIGPELDAAHAICQRYEGTQNFDCLHGLIHRIEGDESNARYWYRRAGRDWNTHALDAEWAAIRQLY